MNGTCQRKKHEKNNALAFCGVVGQQSPHVKVEEYRFTMQTYCTMLMNEPSQNHVCTVLWVD